ncbi:unnamed protein product, partial [Dovyalis caffra]
MEMQRGDHLMRERGPLLAEERGLLLVHSSYRWGISLQYIQKISNGMSYDERGGIHEKKEAIDIKRTSIGHD